MMPTLLTGRQWEQYTDDGAIPWKMFYVYWQAMFPVLAMHRLQTAAAFSQAAAQVMGGKEGRKEARKTQQAWQSEAFPER